MVRNSIVFGAYDYDKAMKTNFRKRNGGIGLMQPIL